MKIRKIHIKNYRALDDITINFNEKMNVIYGTNGIGKSSIIYIMHDILGVAKGIISKNQNTNNTIFSPGRIRDTEQASTAIIEFDNGEQITVTAEKGPEQVFGKIDEGTQCISFIPGMTKQGIIQQVENNEITFGLVVPPKFAYTRGIFDFERLKENFFNLEFEENRNKVIEYNQTGQMKYSHPALKKIREIITKINPDFENISTSGDKNNKLLIVTKKGVPLNVEDQLSSGEASIITMIGEICIDIFSNQNKKDTIVLIDEIDASLHPQWQMKIGKILKESFPEVQFIMTSHSPFIWSGLNRDEILWLDHDDNGNVIKKEVGYAKGGSVEAIITNFFDTLRYDEDFSQEIHIIDEMIRSKKSQDVKNALANMRKKYGNIPIISQFEFKMRMMGL